MASRMGKTSVKDKVAGGLRTAFFTAITLGGIGSVPIYKYATIETTEAKITSYQNNESCSWNYEKGTNECSKVSHVFNTTKGTLVNEPSLFHLKGEDDTRKIWSDAYTGATYRFTTYGVDFGPFEKKVLSAQRVTEEELQERAKQQAEADKARKAEEARRKAEGAAAAGVTTPQQQQAQGQAAQPAQTAAGTPAVVQQGLSGRVSTIDIVYNNNVIQLTVPVEAVGKVTINNVTPLAVPAQPQQQQPRF